MCCGPNPRRCTGHARWREILQQTAARHTGNQTMVVRICTCRLRTHHSSCSRGLTYIPLVEEGAGQGTEQVVRIRSSSRSPSRCRRTSLLDVLLPPTSSRACNLTCSCQYPPAQTCARTANRATCRGGRPHGRRTQRIPGHGGSGRMRPRGLPLRHGRTAGP